MFFSACSLPSLFLLASATAAVPQAPPPMMNSAHKSGLSCFTPFRCIGPRRVPTPQPGRDQALVKVAGSSVNPCDVDYIEFGVGCNGGAGTLGMDLSGTVVSLPSATGACGHLAVGDEVWADVGGVKGDTGAMAEYAVVNCGQTGLKPKSLNFTAAGTIPLVGFTSLECLKETGAPWAESANTTVVITSGTGGTGFVAIQIAKALGAARVITSTSGAANIALAKRLGADVVVDYKVEDIFAALPDDSVDVVYDNYGSKGEADKAMRTMKKGGVYLVLPGGNGGTLSRHPKEGVRQINFGMAKATNHSLLDELAALFDAGQMQPHVFQSFPLADAAKAFALSKTGTVVGKVAVTIY
jgi:NADPH:quinone reductase-like Zn-dependent oxidoreductase